jgi:hypothetical protein
VNAVHITMPTSVHQQPSGLEDLTRSHNPPSPSGMGERDLLDLQIWYPVAGSPPHLESSRPTMTQSPRSSKDAGLLRMDRRLRPTMR